MDRTRLEATKLKIKNYWRRNRKLASLIVLFAIIGVAVAGVNNWYFNQANTQFVLEEPQLIDQENDATFSFELDSPELATDTTISLFIENIDDGSDIYISVNDEELDEITSESTTISVPSEVLENDNEVVIYEDQIDFQQQELISA